MYRRILVALDGSPTSDRALKEAIGLAQALSASLHLTHVVDVATLNWDAEFADPTTIWQAMVDTGQSILARGAETCRAAGVEADTRLVEISTLGRRIPEAVVEEAKQQRADLIVAGTHGRRGLSHLFLGSVAEGIVRVASCPVLLVRAS